MQGKNRLNEGDRWHHKPQRLKILNRPRKEKENVYAAAAIHRVAGFPGRERVETARLVASRQSSSSSSIPMNP